MENEWSYKNLSHKEGHKPGSRHFQYFFVVSEGGLIPWQLKMSLL